MFSVISTMNIRMDKQKFRKSESTSVPYYNFSSPTVTKLAYLLCFVIRGEIVSLKD